MTEEPKDGQEEVKVEETPQGEEQPEVLSTSEEPSEEELPEDTKDRTKEQFEKLKQHNAELKTQLEERKNLPSVVDFLSGTPPEVTPEAKEHYAPKPQPAKVEEPQLVDQGGYVNADVLRQQLDQARIAREKAEGAERRAMDAEARISRFEQDAETKVLYKDYPELDPLSEVFKQEAYDLVRNEITSQIVTSGKRDSLKAASKMSKYFRKEEKPASNDKVIEQRTQASTSGKTSKRESSDSLQDLKTRNDQSAIAERLNRIGA